MDGAPWAGLFALGVWSVPAVEKNRKIVGQAPGVVLEWVKSLDPVKSIE